MTKPLIPSWEGRKPLVGMVHLRPLPGSPRGAEPLEQVIAAALADAEALAEGGADGILLENFGDTPFFPGRVPAHTVAQMTAAAVAIRQRVRLPLGINVLRNDGRAALAVAHAVGADFLRVNVLTGARLTDQGVLQGIAPDLLRDRVSLNAETIRILADVQVKHSAPLADYGLEAEVEDVLYRGGADGVIVSGQGTGKPTPAEDLRRARAAAGDAPVWVGSGVTADTLDELLPLADGFIVGTWCKQGGLVTEPVDPARVRTLAARLSSGR